MCSVMLPASSICGVTSRTMPEKYGENCGVASALVTAPVVTLVTGITETFETKSCSSPTLSTAFWLLSVATRGLDSTWTLPWVSRKVRSAAKFELATASPSTAPAGPFNSCAVAASRNCWVVTLPACCDDGDDGRVICPKPPLRLNTAQLIPDWN